MMQPIPSSQGPTLSEPRYTHAMSSKDALLEWYFNNLKDCTPSTSTYDQSTGRAGRFVEFTMKDPENSRRIIFCACAIDNASDSTSATPVKARFSVAHCLLNPIQSSLGYGEYTNLYEVKPNMSAGDPPNGPFVLAHHEMRALFERIVSERQKTPGREREIFGGIQQFYSDALLPSVELDQRSTLSPELQPIFDELVKLTTLEVERREATHKDGRVWRIRELNPKTISGGYSVVDEKTALELILKAPIQVALETAHYTTSAPDDPLYYPNPPKSDSERAPRRRADCMFYTRLLIAPEDISNLQLQLTTSPQLYRRGVELISNSKIEIRIERSDGSQQELFNQPANQNLPVPVRPEGRQGVPVYFGESGALLCGPLDSLVNSQLVVSFDRRECKFPGPKLEVRFPIEPISPAIRYYLLSNERDGNAS